MSADSQAVASTDAATKGTALFGAGLAAVYGIMILVIGVFGVVNTLIAEAITVPQPTAVDIDAGASGSLQLVEGTFRMADVTITGIGDSVRALLASSMILDVIMHLSVAFGVFMLCIALMRQRPFMPAMVRTLIFVAFALVICGMLSSGLLGFANMEIASALDRPGFPMVANIDFTAALVGVALAVVATAFQVGRRLQRDTEGLI